MLDKNLFIMVYSNMLCVYASIDHRTKLSTVRIRCEHDGVPECRVDVYII